jgi:hypothetical protein
VTSVSEEEPSMAAIPNRSRRDSMVKAKRPTMTANTFPRNFMRF